jgi:polyisoprenoid-binding protein YceI
MNSIIYNLKSILLALTLTVSISVHAEEVCAPFKNEKVDANLLNSILQAAEEGDLYRIKSGSSRMRFCVNSLIGIVEAEFHNFQGGLALKDVNQQGTAMVSIDVDSLETDSVIIEGMLKGESFFDSEQYPDILFVSSGFDWISDEKVILKGDLTLHGITRAVAFYVNLERTKSEQGQDLITLNASTTIQRSEFGMYTLLPMVNDRVSLCMSIDAYRHKV